MKIKPEIQNKKKTFISLTILFCAFLCMYLIVLFAYIFPVGMQNTPQAITYAGVTLILFCGMAYYLMFSDNLITKSYRKSAAMSLTMLLTFALSVLFAHLLNLTFLAPFALCALVVALLMDSKAGFFANFTVILAFFSAQLLFTNTQQLELYYPLFGGVFASIIASYLTTQNCGRLRYIFVGLQLSVFALVSTVMCYFMFVRRFVLNVFLADAAFAFASGLLCVMLMFVLVPLFERLFNIVTNFRLAEITSTGQPLLKRLYEEAPALSTQF